MKLKCFKTSVVAAIFTTTAFVFNSHLTYFLAAALNCLDNILAPLLICALSSQCKDLAWLTAECSAIELLRNIAPMLFTDAKLGL